MRARIIWSVPCRLRLPKRPPSYYTNMSLKVPNLVWIGPRGAGKRTALQGFLESYTRRIGQTYILQAKRWLLQGADGDGGEISTSVEDSGSSAKSEKKGLVYEVSRIHQGFDVARMSLQDKNYIQAILETYQGTSNILLGEGPAASHVLVIYHAHLLSEESVILLQELLEKYSDTVSILLTAEYPLSHRLADWFMEIPYPGPDRSYTTLRGTHAALPALPEDGQGDAWMRFFQESWDKWRAHRTKQWSVDDVLVIRQWIYTCMQRNLRWCDMIMYWTQTIYKNWKSGQMSVEEAVAAFRVLSEAKTGGGYVMLPSYRIPVAWENFMMDFLRTWAGA